MHQMQKKVVLATQRGRALAEKTCEFLSMPLGQALVGRFNDGEVRIEIQENIRGTDVFIIGPTNPPAENLMELVLLAAAARGSSPARVTVIPTYFGYGRQEKKDKPRVPIAARTVIQMIESTGCDRVLLFDLHSEATMATFNIRTQVDHLYASAVALPYLATLVTLGPTVIGSPDAGGVPRARALSQMLGLGNEIAIFLKQRPKPGELDESTVTVIGDVADKNVLLVDDIIDTATTLSLQTKAAKHNGARDVYAYATHGLLSGSAIQKLDASGMKEVIITDTIWHPPQKLLEAQSVKIVQISICKLLARAIGHLNAGLSLSELIPKKPSD